MNFVFYLKWNHPEHNRQQTVISGSTQKLFLSNKPCLLLYFSDILVAIFEYGLFLDKLGVR